MNQVISVLNTITVKSGGLTRVSLNRCEAFIDKGMRSYVVTTDFISNFTDTIKVMRADGRIHRSVNVINLYQYYSIANRVRKSPLEDVFFNTIHNPSTLEIRREKEVIGVGKVITLYRNNKNETFIIEINDDKNNLVWGMLILENSDDFIYNTHEQLHTYWLNELADQCKKTFLISDQPVCCNAVLNVTAENTFKILTIHNNHFRPPYKPGAFINDRYGNVLSAMPYVDAIVTLTKKQKEHILEQYKNRNNLYVIGNPLTTFEIDKNIKRDPYLCVAVCRLVKMKNIKEMIDIFLDAVSVNDKLKLEIWGDGEEKESLQQYVEGLNASKFITFKGYTSNPGIIFQKAAMSLATSIFEGFGVSFAESLSLGTPVISYKTLYGPEEIINNDIDGFLVNNRKEFSERIIELAGNVSLQDKMGRNGIKNITKFSKENIINKWLALFSKLDEKKAKVNYINRTPPSIYYFYNETGSAYGWIYVNYNDKVASILKNGSDLQVTKVSYKKDFKGEKIKIVEGDYKITSLEYIEDRNHYRFKLKKENFIYNGALGMKCLKMSLT